jgi:hypothetical protein
MRLVALPTREFHCAMHDGLHLIIVTVFLARAYLGKKESPCRLSSLNYLQNINDAGVQLAVEFCLATFRYA